MFNICLFQIESETRQKRWNQKRMIRIPKTRMMTFFWRKVTRTSRRRRKALRRNFAARKRPAPCFPARRCSSSSPPSTWSATWAARNAPDSPRRSAWPRRRWRSGSRTGGISGSGRSPPNWRPRTSVTRRGSCACLSCTTSTRRARAPRAWPSRTHFTTRIPWSDPCEDQRDSTSN